MSNNTFPYGGFVNVPGYSIIPAHPLPWDPFCQNQNQSEESLKREAEEEFERSAKRQERPKAQSMPKFLNYSSQEWNAGNEMVELYVGEKEQLFRVHKARLCAIPYFNSMFNSGFAETKEGRAKFPEDDPKTFGVFIEWVYSGQLAPITRTRLGSLDDGFQYELIWEPTRLYGLADKLCLPQLQNQIMDEWVAGHKRFNLVPSPEMIARCYRDTPPDSAPRRGYMTPEKIHQLMVDWPELNYDTLKSLMEFDPNEDPYYLDARTVSPSQYHVVDLSAIKKGREVAEDHNPRIQCRNSP
ncbi:hypothetical protein V8E51_015756 [Hyaloscypha variabilis]